MKILNKILSQKGQGLLEYALIIGFVGAIALFVMINGGFGGAIENAFGSASDNLANAGTLTNNSDEETSFDYETLTAEDIAPTYKTLN